MKTISKLCLAALLSSSAEAQQFLQQETDLNEDKACVAPGICTPPESAKFSKLAPIIPRSQWAFDGGFCGSLSIQSIAMTKGAYISQDYVRKATPFGGGHGNHQLGYEILPANIGQALDNLKISHELWDSENQPKPQSPNFMKWMKKNIVNGNPIVNFVMCKGDEHNAYGLGHFDHIEPFWGVYSNNPLDDEEIYDDDWLVHGSNYDPDGDQNLGYFRKFKSMPDTPDMEGNCKEAQPGWGKNEMYPCLYDQQNWGAALQGLVDPLQRSKSINVQVFDDKWDIQLQEPNVRDNELAVDFSVKLTISGLKSNTVYELYQWNDSEDYPTDSNFEESNWVSKVELTSGSSSTLEHKYHQTIRSDKAAYWACTEKLDQPE